MNIHEDITPSSELNNNISAGSSVAKSTGCGVEMACHLTPVHKTDTPHNQLCVGDYTVENSTHTKLKLLDSDDTGENSHGALRLDPEGVAEVNICPEGHVTTDNAQTADCGKIRDGETETMRNCSCDEGSLCFCPSSVFKGGLHGRSPRDNVARCPKEVVFHEVFSSDDDLTSREMDETKRTEVVVKDSEEVKECKMFMEDLVDRIFNNSASIGQEDNAKFGEYCQSEIGRQWFARLVDSQRVNSKKVNEETFYRLVQFFAVCLFECSIADDFTPGKSLMNMCFTFYHEHEGFPRCDDTTQKCFLYSQLTEQPIWKSLRFWNAAFFDAVHQERKQRSPGGQVNWRHLSSEERESSEILNENITFGQLATFLHNMMELGLPRDICEQFLDKMATIGNLSPDQKDLIQSNIANYFRTDCQEISKNKKQHKNRLSFMKRKIGQDLQYSGP